MVDIFASLSRTLCGKRPESAATDSSQPFRAFAYEEMPSGMPPDLRQSSTATSSCATSLTDADCRTTMTAGDRKDSLNDIQQIPATATTRRATSNTSIRHPPISNPDQAASPTHTRHSTTANAARNGAAPSTNSGQSRSSSSTTSSADATFFTQVHNSMTTATTYQAASHTNTRIHSTIASDHLLSPTKLRLVTSALPYPREPAQCRRIAAANTPHQQTHPTKRHLLDIPASEILTALIKHQVNLPTKDVILATGNPLGILLPTEKKFILVDAKIRNGRVIEGRVAQVRLEAFVRHMAMEYEKAFVGGVEEVEYPLGEPLIRTRGPYAPRRTLEEMRAAVAREVQEVMERMVEGVVADIVEEAVASMVREWERQVETIVAEILEEAVAGSVEKPVKVKDVKRDDLLVV